MDIKIQVEEPPFKPGDTVQIVYSNMPELRESGLTVLHSAATVHVNVVDGSLIRMSTTYKYVVRDKWGFIKEWYSQVRPEQHMELEERPGQYQA